MKSTNHFKNTIQAYLEERVASDTLFELAYTKENKNLDDCITYILNAVQKSGCNGFTREEIFGLAVHYYDEDSIEIGSPINCKVVVNHTVILTEDEQQEIRKEAIQKAHNEVYNRVMQPKKKANTKQAEVSNQLSLLQAMKPKNKFQQRVVEASKSLPKLTKKQTQWGYDHAIQYVGRRTEKGIVTCTKCSHIWQGMGELANTLLGCECPNCKSKLIAKTTKKRTFDDSYYMNIITAHKDYQVIRTIMLSYNAKIGEPKKLSYSEVMQRWIAPDGKHYTFAKLRQTMGTMCIDSWIFHTPLELRNENSKNKFCINVYDKIGSMGEIYPHQKLIPEMKRTGYKKALYGQKPLDLFRTLLTDSRAETLLKAGQTKLLKRLMDSGWTRNIDNYWASVRICIRNGYKISDAILWCDYIDMLRFFGKDLHNAKYVCPKDLKVEHDRYVAKRAKADAQQELEKQLEKEAEYREAKAKFFGIVFSDGKISVRVLESVAEIIQEGKLMHHCVGSYHSKTDSLILSACIDGKKIETVELSLSQLRVIQSRGYEKYSIIKTNHCISF